MKIYQPSDAFFEAFIGFLACLVIVTAFALTPGCGTAAKTAAAANGVVIVGVDSAMQAWASYTSKQVTPGTPPTPQLNSEILTVSNAYVGYYNAELTFSNVQSAYVQSPSTNIASAITTAGNALAASETNIVALVTLFTK